MALLQIDNLHVNYGNIRALRGISLSVEAGEIVTLIGGNGAGKTTTLKTISGVLRPRQGNITLQGQAIDKMPPHRVVEMGVAHAPEGRGIFGRMSVWENLEMGMYARRDRRAVQEDVERVFSLFPRLKERIRQLGGTLSGGEQQMLAIGRALMARPTVLLLDEPSMGLSPILVQTIFDVIREINARGTTILLVEQNALMALRIAHRGYVLQTGQIVLNDTARNLRANDMVRKAYLGEI